jgi:hypothetical protein
VASNTIVHKSRFGGDRILGGATRAGVSAVTTVSFETARISTARRTVLPVTVTAENQATIDIDRPRINWYDQF